MSESDDFASECKSIIDLVRDTDNPRLIVDAGALHREPAVRHQFGRLRCQSLNEAQLCLLAMYKQLENSSLPPKERRWKQLIVRKIADSIAFHLMSHDLHRFRRLSLHDTPPKIDLKDLEQVIDFCNSKHKNNVDYFGLACDLTASVHVGDIMSIDQPPQCPVIKKQVNVKQRSSRHISA